MKKSHQNSGIKSKTKLPEPYKLVLRRKWKWARHLARLKDDWALYLTKWTPQSFNKRIPLPGRPTVRWKDKIKKCAGIKWVEEANDRGTWSQIEAVYIQQWRNNAETDHERESDSLSSQ